MWPLFRVQDRVRVRASGRVGYANQIEPNERGDEWLFEVIFERNDAALHDESELDLVEISISGPEHGAEIELAVRASAENAAVVGLEIARVAAATFAIEGQSLKVEDDRIHLELRPRDHPREAMRAFMEGLGSAWLIEDDGWYANVHWAGESFPIAGVDAVDLFLRPWRDPRPAARLPGERIGQLRPAERGSTEGAASRVRQRSGMTPEDFRLTLTGTMSFRCSFGLYSRTDP